ncbi:MAG TPA: DinB family protein, partial [Rummeliibacillus sp.]|nr:DinB family protein [Rummeliibacillus sp.]
PIAHYPNLIQCIDILGIHEKHHFLLCKKYYNLQ